MAVQYEKTLCLGEVAAKHHKHKKDEQLLDLSQTIASEFHASWHQTSLHLPKEHKILLHKQHRLQSQAFLSHSQRYEHLYSKEYESRRHYIQLFQKLFAAIAAVESSVGVWDKTQISGRANKPVSNPPSTPATAGNKLLAMGFFVVASVEEADNDGIDK
ncbi:hypothetical protein Bca4012_058088 [Brassica carinata]